MVKIIVLRFSVFIFAMLFLGFTLSRVSGVKYAFTESPHSNVKNAAEDIDVVYDMPYYGTVLPGSPLWEVRVLRDRARMRLSANDFERAKVSLSLADARLSISYKLWERGENGDAVSVVQKGSGYLEYAGLLARRSGSDQRLDLLRQVCLSSLKYREIMEMMLAESSDEGRPTVHKIMNTPKNVYLECASELEKSNVTPPHNPFN